VRTRIIRAQRSEKRRRLTVYYFRQVKKKGDPLKKKMLRELAREGARSSLRRRIAKEEPSCQGHKKKRIQLGEKKETDSGAVCRGGKKRGRCNASSRSPSSTPDQRKGTEIISSILASGRRRSRATRERGRQIAVQHRGGGEKTTTRQTAGD